MVEILGYELNPTALLFGVVGGIVGLVVASQVETGLLMKAAIFIATAIACYVMVSFQMNR